MDGKVSLHSSATGKRLTQAAKPLECQFLTYSSLRTRFLPGLKTGASAHGAP
jgi:hypothetical protein